MAQGYAGLVWPAACRSATTHYQLAFGAGCHARNDSFQLRAIKADHVAG
jgi:hypothetical protein